MATIHLTSDLKIESIPRRERWDPRPLVAISPEARLPFPTVAPDEDLVKRLPANNQVLSIVLLLPLLPVRRPSLCLQLVSSEGGKKLIHPTVHIK
jgi:hypothetical protein